MCNDTLQCPETSPFYRAVILVVYDLINNTEDHGFNYYNSPVIDEGSAYGHATCNGELSKVACELCVSVADDKLEDFCGTDIGGQIQLENCRFRYENYPFTE